MSNILSLNGHHPYFFGHHPYFFAKGELNAAFVGRATRVQKKAGHDFRVTKKARLLGMD